ncbi:hypothetical protein ATN38_04660 [Rhodococcus sp. FH8]|nr:hypothetical protein AOT96_34205 [Rhodococcus sp. 008]MBW0286089.1 hypothetical protein [Rhodococcus sp. FH8]OKA12736.1 hypothetical protein BS618_22145 [Rhodococcus erythropolis]REK81783.1 hypothetical protein DVG80_21160 [Rhodococcus erythropolis]UJC82156.1 hypothetical protein D4768_30510 [Rhodococcus erythropolis]
MLHMQPAPPSTPMPEVATEAMGQLLGFLFWFGIITLVAALMIAGGVLWHAFLHGTVTRASQRIFWILGCAAALGASAAIANMILR